MSESLLIALVGAGQVIIVALLGTLGPILLRRVKRVERDTRVVKGEVKNDHSTNLRVEQDTRHTQNTRKLNVIMRLLGNGAATLETMKEDIAYLRKFGHENRQRIEQIEENTTPHPRKERP